MAAMSALGFEPILSELGTEAARVPPVLLKLEEEEGEEEEEEKKMTESWKKIDLRLRALTS